MDKILEALNKLLPEDQISEVTTALEGILADTKKELEDEYNKNLEEAYGELSTEKEEAEKVAREGYRQAYEYITEQRNRMEIMKAEYDAAIEEGYEEAYQQILAERGKGENLEVDLHEEYEKKFNESKDYMVDKLDVFLRSKGKEIYEAARRDVVNDPAMVEHKVVLDRIVENVNGYITDEDRILATGSRLKDSQKSVDDLSGRVKILESRNIKLSMDNTKLNEAMKEAAELINESKEAVETGEKNVRTEKAKKATGRGEIVTEDVKVVAEHHNDDKGNKTDDDELVVEGLDQETLHEIQVLAGTRTND